MNTAPTSVSLSLAGGTLANPLREFRNRILCGDALTVMGQMRASSVNLVITSPPYNIRNSTGNGLKERQRRQVGECCAPARLLAP